MRAVPSGRLYGALVCVSLTATGLSGAAFAAEGAIEEILVTARLREESLQDSPIAVTAMSGESLEQMNLANLEDIAQTTPSLYLNPGRSDGLFIRGAAKSQADLVGAKVVRIGRLTADEAYLAVRGLIGRDNEMNARFFAPFLLAMPEVLHAIGAIDEPDAAPLLLEQAGTRIVTVLRPAGLATMKNAKVTVHFTEDSKDMSKTATRVIVQTAK